MRRKYKTKFPVARIKKIMQTDDDVGKMSQATPVLISKALELFMQSLIDLACEETRKRDSHRLTTYHLKQVIMNVGQYDFLRDLVRDIPDPTEKERGRGKGRVAADLEEADGDEEEEVDESLVLEDDLVKEKDEEFIEPVKKGRKPSGIKSGVNSTVSTAGGAATSVGGVERGGGGKRGRGRGRGGASAGGDHAKLNTSTTPQKRKGRSKLPEVGIVGGNDEITMEKRSRVEVVKTEDEAQREISRRMQVSSIIQEDQDPDYSTIGTPWQLDQIDVKVEDIPPLKKRVWE